VIERISKRIYYGWLIVAASGGTEFANAASAIGILTIFVNPLTEEFGWSRTEISAVTSLGAILGASMAPFSGRLVDRIGSRWVLTLGGALVALACVYLASIHTLLGFYVGFTIVRISDQGLIKIGAAPTVGKWFQRYRGRAIALVFFSGAAGIMVMAPVVQLAISAWGWRAAWLLLAAVMAVLGVVPSFVLIRRQPEDHGLVLDGSPGPVAADISAVNRDENSNRTLRQVVATPSFWLILVALFLASTAGSGVTLHLVPHLTQQGLSVGKAVGVISVMSTASAAGILVLGFLAERLPPRLLMACVCLTTSVDIVVLMFADSLAEAYLFALLHGVASGGLNTLAPILWASYYGRGILGSMHGLSRASQVAGFALGPLILGIAFDRWGRYQDALIYLAVLAVISFVLVALAGRPRGLASRVSTPT
jgi:sugar phosphate permease